MLNQLRHRLKKHNILIVDDNIELLNIAQEYFDHETRYKLHVAESAEEALKIISRIKIDLLITDVIMPVRDGFWLLQKIKEMGKVIPSIVMSGNSSVGDSMMAHRLGAKLYMNKPFPLNQLEEEARKILFHSKDRNETHYESQSIYNAISGQLKSFISDNSDEVEVEPTMAMCRADNKG